MSFLAWIVLGLIAGFIGSKIVNHRGEGVFLDIILGIVGAVVGGDALSAEGRSQEQGDSIFGRESAGFLKVGEGAGEISFHTIGRA